MSGKKHVIDQGDSSDSASSHVRGQQVLKHISDALSGLQFGQITVLVQDGVVVQIERTEKRRLK